MAQAQNTREPYIWDSVAIGGGGYVVGIVIHPTEPGLMYIRTDVGGAYRWDPENKRWIQLMDSISLEDQNLYGVDGIALDPQNPDVVYLAAGKYPYSTPCDVLKSTDRGKTWKRTGLNKAFSGNGDLRWIGECIAVDPHNSDIVYVGTRSDGLFKSTDAGSTWQSVDGVPKGADGKGIRNIMFDPNTAVDGVTQTLYAGVQEKGIYVSKDGGVSWSVLSDTITAPHRMDAAADGTLYVTSEKGVFKYDGSQWAEITPRKGKPYTALAVDPKDPNHIVAIEGVHAFKQPIWNSTDGGQTWNSASDNAELHRDVPWWPDGYFSAATAAAVFDPHESNRVWFTDWYGIWTTPDITAQPVVWNTYQNGHEEMVSFTMISTPVGANLLTGIADNDGMRHTDLTQYPTKKYGGPGMQETTGIDFCESDPNYVARVGSSGWGEKGNGGYSTDNGVTWTPYKDWPFGANGKLAMSATDPKLIVVVPIGEKPQRSINLGDTWEETEGGPSNTVKQFWSWNHPLASDRVNGNVFYLFSSEGGFSKFYRSDDGGKTWNKVSMLPGADLHYVKAAPGMEGEVWVSLDDKGLYQSQDAGQKFTKVEGVQSAHLFSFGKNPPGKDNPAVFVYGVVNDEEGIFRSDDMGATWIRINDASTMIGDNPNCMEGDRQVFGRVYIGTNGRGYYYGEPVNKVEESGQTADTEDAGGETQPQEGQDQSDKGSSAMVYGIAGAALVLLLGAGYWYLKKRK